MNDLVEQILELLKGKKTAIDMQAIMFQSRSTTYRKLKDEGTSISEIKNLYQDCGAFSVIRKKMICLGEHLKKNYQNFCCVIRMMYGKDLINATIWVLLSTKRK